MAPEQGSPKMLLKGIACGLTLFVACVAIFGYVPLPDGLEDPYRVQGIMGYWRLYSWVVTLKQLLTFKTPTMASFQETIILEGTPATASLGDIKVTRDRIADVPVIVYRPPTTLDLSPAIIYMHGGGWVTGSADLYDKTVYQYAECTGLVVFSVDYRRAPQHPFPAPFKDCLDVTQHILRHGKQYGVDVKKVGVMGDSAGANLAAAVALKLSKEKTDNPSPMFQVLHYPSLQSFDLRLPSFVDLNDSMPHLTTHVVATSLALYFGLDENNIDYYATVMSENRHISPQLRKSKYAEYVNVSLLPKRFQTPNKTAPAITVTYDSNVFEKVKHIVTNPMVSPLMASDLTGVPPAFIHVCEFDVLRDDGLMYAERLRRAGVKAQIFFGRGGFHSDIERIVPEFLFPRSGEMAVKAACGFVKKMLRGETGTG